MEGTVSESAGGVVAMVQHQVSGQNECTRRLEERRHREDGHHQANDPRQPDVTQRLPDDEPTLQADPPTGKQEEQRGGGHDAQTADLDQRGYDELTERSEDRGRIHRDEPGDAHGRGGREERIDVRERACRDGHARQRQDRRPHEDGGSETE